MNRYKLSVNMSYMVCYVEIVKLINDGNGIVEICVTKMANTRTIHLCVLIESDILVYLSNV